MLTKIKKIPRYLLIPLFLLAPLFAWSAFANHFIQNQQIPPLNLSQELDKPQQVILDIREKEEYEFSHIPNAINIPYSEFNKTKNSIAGYVIEPINFKNLLSKNGITNDDSIIIYGDLAYLHSTRILWVFEFYGHKKTQLLQGGYQAWEEQNLPVSDKPFMLKSSNYVIQINPEKLVSKFQVFMATKNKQYTIIDARPPKQFEGLKSLTTKTGRIPNSINIPWFEVLNNRAEEDSYDSNNKVVDYKKLNQLEKIFKDIPKDKKIILYCNSASEASVLHFALKQINRKAQLYDGSWYEWSADDKMPIENKTE